MEPLPYNITVDGEGVRSCNLSLMGGVVDIDVRARDEKNHRHWPVLVYLPSLNIRSGRAHIERHRKVIVMAALTAHLKFLFGDDAEVGDPGISPEGVEQAVVTLNAVLKDISSPHLKEQTK